ncbi:neuronal acetylcholine receptor subunit alpha-10-like [Tubulanus polymorphus]|uniref:neuronal acetylcholine receptor subunit alpha-10-like n=1 Tax=Tubulanus polymorphus TaxID=672921 RepID=UPI003DA376A6
MATADEHEYRLVQTLLRNYDKRLRPSINYSLPLNVSYGVALSQIIDVDEKNQIITTNCWINQQWLDPKLTWSPDKYNGIKDILIPYTDVWKPDIILYNNANTESMKSAVSTNMIVNYLGNVTWLSMVIFKSSCSIDVRYFPFDEQNCTMDFASWTYDGEHINLIQVGEKGDTSSYMQNTEWDLRAFHVRSMLVTFSCCEVKWPIMRYTVQMRRKPLFYIFNMVLPCNLITLVALLGFYVPSDSGEKITMGITTLLSMTVFLMIVADSMPATSDVLPLVGLYYGITIAIVSFATAMTVFTLNIHHKGFRGKEVPAWIKKICFCFLARILCIKLDLPDYNDDGSVRKQKANSSSNIRLHSNHSRDQELDNRESNYIKLKQSKRKWLRPETGKTHMTTLDFVPQSEFKRRYDSEPGSIPENGGLSPRFSSKLRNPNNTNRPSSSNSTVDDFEKQFLRVLQKVYQTIEKNEMRLAEQDRRDAIKLEWQQVALVVDRLLLSMFVMATLGVTLAILFQAPHSFNSLFGTRTVHSHVLSDDQQDSSDNG